MEHIDEKTFAQLARLAGFGRTGFCSAAAFTAEREAVERGPEIAERRQLRFDPTADDPRTKSIAVMLWPYVPAAQEEDGCVFVDGDYFASNAAYHAARALEAQLTEAGHFAKANVSYPAREAALRAGMGVIGQNGMLITPEYGSRFVIILMATDIVHTAPDCGEHGGCLHCGRCAKACPAGAIDARGLSREAYAFIAGLLKHVRGMAAITNPLVNSYKRLVPGYEAPCYLAWSASNRSALIRIPAARAQATRVELRCPDPTCNPYLALAVCLAAGLDGIENGLTPPAEITENIFAMDDAARAARGVESLPGTLKEAIDAMEADALVCETLGSHVTTQYVEGKRREWDAYRTHVSDWEIGKYLVTY